AIAIQRNATAQVQGASTVVSFELDLTAITSTLSSLSDADLAAELQVFAAGRAVAQPIPVVLVRQPVARLLLPPGQADAELSPVGQRVLIEVDGLRSTDAGGVAVLVTTRDPDAGVLNATVTR